MQPTLILLLLILVVAPVTALSQQETPPAAETEVWLVTYGPGEIYWQRFGHNGIWVRDPGLGLDHVFNFGFFDFEQEDFFLRFLQGRMLYFSAAQAVREEFAGYINQGRSIRAQKLDLAPGQKLRLVEFLLDEIRPENRDYLYDYYLHNCSTRVRDALDQALGGLLRQEFEARQGYQSWRDHTRRLTTDDFWLYLGLETGLGSPVDQSITRWQEMFIPGEMADALATVVFSGGGVQRPLVTEDVMLHESAWPDPPGSPPSLWPRYLLAALALLAAVGLLGRFAPSAPRRLALAWMWLGGLAGLTLLFFWFGTDHSVARLNLNLLIFSPLWIPLLLWQEGRRLWLFVLPLSLIGVLMPLLPPYQYTADVLAAFLPLNLSSAWLISRSRLRPADPPGVPGAGGR